VKIVVGQLRFITGLPLFLFNLLLSIGPQSRPARRKIKLFLDFFLKFSYYKHDRTRSVN
jgi:hypothetical protein